MSSRGPITRRTLIRRGLIAGGAIAAGGGAVAGCGGSKPLRSKTTSVMPSARRAPNILVILVDQLRTPQWFQNEPVAAGLMPNLARIRRGGVYFASHYTASNDCTPARAALLTGLYTQQTGCLLTGGSTLDPKFLTWGSMLREQGYDTYWYGKWHLTHRDNRWTPRDRGVLDRYGFSGGTYPSPDGAPGQGWRVDPLVARQFRDWYPTVSSKRPWCTTVSFVNPHDIAWWYRWTDQARGERTAPAIVGALPPNFETPAQMRARRKPRLQQSLQDTAQSGFGRVPYSGGGVKAAWLPFMDLYLKLTHRVDAQIGQVLDTLLSRPEIAANTVIVFSSDHGEYGASHGMRGKGAAAYEEAVRVPLIVKDLRGHLGVAPSQPRTGLTSSVDVTPLLLSIATGSNAWRRESHYQHIARRHDMAHMLADPGAVGRRYILHSTDEIVTEFATELYAANAPLHVSAIRTRSAKYATYSNWQPSTNRIVPRGQESELYDYSTRGGRLEIDNLAGASKLESGMRAQLEAAVRDEMREPVPGYLQAAQRDGYTDYYTSAKRAVIDATRLRRRIEETERAAKAAEKLGVQ